LLLHTEVEASQILHILTWGGEKEEREENYSISLPGKVRQHLTKTFNVERVYGSRLLFKKLGTTLYEKNNPLKLLRTTSTI
jgi:hypothetical protein